MNKNKKLNQLKSTIFYSLVIILIFSLVRFSHSWSRLGYDNKIFIEISDTNIIRNDFYYSIVQETIKDKKNIEDIDLKELTSLIENHPYIHVARISRHFPSKIIIDLVERSPIAIVNKDPIVLLDKYGVVLPDLGTLRTYNLPVMSNFITDPSFYPSGDVVLSEKVKECLLFIADLKFNYAQLYDNLSTLSITSEDEIELTLASDPTKIYLGSKDVYSRVNILKKFQKKLRPKKISDFSYLDMRFKNQIIAKGRHS